MLYEGSKVKKETLPSGFMVGYSLTKQVGLLEHFFSRGQCIYL